MKQTAETAEAGLIGRVRQTAETGLIDRVRQTAETAEAGLVDTVKHDS